MNSLVAVNIYIVLLYPSILVSLTSASELGISSCRYLGEMEEDGKKCHEDVVKIEKLPRHCTSFVYFGVVCNTNYDIKPNDLKYGLERLGSLVEYEGRAHHVFLFYTHGSNENWNNVLLKGDHSIVAQSVQNFVREHPVKGLILNGIDEGSLNDIVKNSHQSVIDYVKTIKNMNPNLEIGLYLSARSLIEMKIDMDHISKLNPIMDFYLVEFQTFNDCSTNFLHDGITPMDSSNPDVLTLNKFAGFLDNSTIAKDKLYFEFLISPIPKPTAVQDYKPCEISYNEYCENEEDKISYWCADNTDYGYTGEFTQKYAKGFVGSYIDLVDRDDKCKCGKYCTFEMMVNGFNRKTDPKDCDALKAF